MSVVPSIMPGVVATLASGGVRMTVTSVDGDNVTCTWFAGTTLRSHDFPICALCRLDDVSRIERVVIETKAQTDA